MLVISFIGFSIKNQIGDPVRDLVGERVTPAEREALRDELGSHFFTKNRPLR
jgi:peptide/nickel transport system permease protein